MGTHAPRFYRRGSAPLHAESTALVDPVRKYGAKMDPSVAREDGCSIGKPARGEGELRGGGGAGVQQWPEPTIKEGKEWSSRRAAHLDLSISLPALGLHLLQ
jgi:hypothetical protein